jgi:hypothetical protein
MVTHINKERKIEMPKYLCKYYIRNGEAIVTSIVNSSTTLAPKGDYAPIDSMDTVIINNAIISRKVVKIINMDKVKEEIPLTSEDFEITELTPFEKKRNNYRDKINNSISHTLASINALDTFEYLETFSAFLDRGIVITEKNREEKYLEVINTGDEWMIEHLERYLDIKDRVRPLSNFYKNATAALKRLRKAEAEEEVDKIFEDFKKGCA